MPLRAAMSEPHPTPYDSAPWRRDRWDAAGTIYLWSGRDGEFEAFRNFAPTAFRDGLLARPRPDRDLPDGRACLPGWHSSQQSRARTHPARADALSGVARRPASLAA